MNRTQNPLATALGAYAPRRDLVVDVDDPDRASTALDALYEGGFADFTAASDLAAHEEPKTIGLKRGTVRVVPSDDEWPAAFARERSRLCERIGHLVLDIQHVGSTAVPGLAAKPIIDIAVAVASLADVQRCRPLLIGLGYLDRGDCGGEGGYVFVKERAPEVRMHHLHMVAIADPQWASSLLFRDRLRADAVLREDYASLKWKLRGRFACDRQSYTAAKGAFIRRVLDQ